MEKKNKENIRIYYLAGAADIAGDYRTWKEKQSNASSFGGGVFMEQFFQFCHDINATAQLVSTADGINLITDRFILEYRNPNPRNLSGFKYHAKLICYMASVIASIIRFKPDLVLIGIGERYWSMFYIFYFSRIKFVPFFHCTLWPRMKSFEQLTSAQRFLFRLTGSFLKRRCEGILSISDVIPLQLKKIIRGRVPRIIQFRPIYERGMFKDLVAPNWDRSPFRVIYVGRVEPDKGVYDLLDAARILRTRNYTNICFEICGTGHSLSNFKSIVKRDELTNIAVHGHCDRKQLHALYSQSHAVIVPTTENFPEGFNRVSIEAVLCGRPVIISSSAIESKISAAAIEVSPSDAAGLANAIAELHDNRIAYERLCCEAITSQECFYDKDAGWECALRKIATLPDSWRARIAAQ